MGTPPEAEIVELASDDERNAVWIWVTVEPDNTIRLAIGRRNVIGDTATLTASEAQQIAEALIRAAKKIAP
jgi:hypothetical protein